MLNDSTSRLRMYCARNSRKMLKSVFNTSNTVVYRVNLMDNRGETLSFQLLLANAPQR